MTKKPARKNSCASKYSAEPSGSGLERRIDDEACIRNPPVLHCAQMPEHVIELTASFLGTEYVPLATRYELSSRSLVVDLDTECEHKVAFASGAILNQAKCFQAHLYTRMTARLHVTGRLTDVNVAGHCSWKVITSAAPSMSIKSTSNGNLQTLWKCLVLFGTFAECWQRECSLVC